MLYGRDSERRRIGELLDAARGSRSGALVLRGEPGIGKTALLEDTRGRAADMHVLTARGVESESELAFASLHQLVRPAVDCIDRLPQPQRSALRGALGLSAEKGHEHFLVFAACLSLLAELAEQRPVVCLIDDAHWLDAASADALRFVARRLDAEGIVMLFAAREGDVRVFEAPDIPVMLLAGLDPESAGELLARGAGVQPAPAVRDVLLRQTGGNALALLEVPSAMTHEQLAGREPMPESLPTTHQVESVFLERVRRLPGDTQRLLLVAAADDLADLTVVASAGGMLGIEAHALDAAEQAGLVSILGRRLEFRHPLVRSAIYNAATSSHRREAHRALAHALAGDSQHSDRHAWHLAAASLEPDEQTVAQLEAAAERARERGGHVAAAKALQRAAELTADAGLKGRRLVAAAQAASLAGADAGAVTLANNALLLVDDRLLRAEVARILGIAERNRGRPAEGIPILMDAAADVADTHPGTAAELLFYAMMAANDGCRREASAAAKATAARMSPPDDDLACRFLVSLMTGVLAMESGEPDRGTALLQQALELGVAESDARHAHWASACALWVGDDDLVLALADRSIELARPLGAITVLAEALSVRAAVLGQLQRYGDALAAAEEAIGYLQELGAQNLVAFPLSVVAGVAAIRGEDDRAERLAAEVLDIATRQGILLRVSSATRVLAMLDLGRGRWAEALDRYLALSDAGQATSDPFAATVTAPDMIEAAVRAGRTEPAVAALPRFEDWVEQSDARWARPRLAACRALLAGGEEAGGQYDQALDMAADARPFDLARIHLLYGEHLRRERRRLDARGHLRTALDAFERFGAEPWAERARTELRATGETARKRDPSTLSELTPQELQVARLVAQGLSNKEAAAQLYLSKRTVDSHLRNVFAKLGISSRMELPHHPLLQPDSPVLV